MCSAIIFDWSIAMLHSNGHWIMTSIKATTHTRIYISTLIVEMSCIKLSRMLREQKENERESIQSRHHKYAHLLSINTPFIGQCARFHIVSGHKNKIIHFDLANRRHNLRSPTKTKNNINEFNYRVCVFISFIGAHTKWMGWLSPSISKMSLFVGAVQLYYEK